MIEEGFGFEHRPNWRRSILQSVVFYEFVREEEEGEEDGQGESGHVPEVATAAWPDVHQE